MVSLVRFFGARHDIQAPMGGEEYPHKSWLAPPKRIENFGREFPLTSMSYQYVWGGYDATSP